MSLISSTDNSNSNPLFSLFPNPAQTQVQFILLAELIGNDMHLELSDESGKIVLSQALTSHISKLDIQKLNAGYYSVRLYQNQRLMQTEKLVVTR